MSNQNNQPQQPKKLSEGEVKKLVKDKEKIIKSNQIIRK